MTRGQRALALVAVGAVAPGAAHADTPTAKPTAVDVERWAGSATGWWAGLPDARVLGQGHLAVGLATSIAARPIRLRAADGAELGAPVATRATVTLAAAYGVTPVLQVEVAIPIVLQRGDRLAGAGIDEPLDRFTSGDARLGASYAVLAGARIAAAVGGALTLPTGNEWHYAGEASWIADWHGVVTARLGRVGLALGGGVRLRGEEVALSPAQTSGNELFGGVAVAVQLPAVPGVSCDWTALRAIAELDGVLGDKVGGERSPSPLEARIGVRGRIWRGFTLGAIAGHGLVDEVGSPAWRAVVEIAWRDEPRTEAPPPPLRDEPCDDDDEDCLAGRVISPRVRGVDARTAAR